MTNQTGLTQKEVDDRTARGLTNRLPKTYSRTRAQIVRSNVFSYFNIIMTAFFAVLLITGNYKDTLFMGVVVLNSTMGIMQEIKMKKIVDGLCVIAAAQFEVIRGGKRVIIGSEDIVEGDVVIIKSGDQIPVDGKIISCDGLETDESLLTGESEPIIKKGGETVFSGSFAVSGSAVIQTQKVGAECYIGRLSAQAKQERRIYSPLMWAIERIIRVMSYVVLPAGLLLFASQYFYTKTGFLDAVSGTAGAVIGMIPSGLVLLTTVTMALGVLRSAARGAFISRQKSVETLARIDTLCLDKTGTLTSGKLVMSGVFCIDKNYDAEKIVRSLIFAFEEKNLTAQAIELYFKNKPDKSVYGAKSKIPFSSSRKYCAAQLENFGFFAIGAPEFLTDGNDKNLEKLTARGGRIMAVARYNGDCVDKTNAQIIAAVVLEDEIRSDAKEILKKFAKSGVDIKIISGDNPKSVSKIAEKLEISGYENYADMSRLEGADDSEILKIAEKYSIFGRVSPQQKRQLISAYKSLGKTVAMTGDGVNDVPAMQCAHCAVAMASGSGAAKGVADVVLENGFSPMTMVIAEGRRVINNMGRVAVLYLVKTMFSLALLLFFAFAGAKYPLRPIHLTLIGGLLTGMPSFFMAMEKNLAPINKKFTKNVLLKSVSGAAGVILSIIILYALKSAAIISAADYQALCVWITGAVSAIVLFCVAKPLNAYRTVLCTAASVLFVGAMVVFGWFIGINPLSVRGWIIFAALAAVNAAVVPIMNK